MMKPLDPARGKDYATEQPSAPRKPKDRMAWLEKRGHIRPEHVVLGEKLIKLYEAKQREPSPRMQFDQGGGSGQGGRGDSATIGRITAHSRWDRAFWLVGPIGEAIITCVIIDGMSLNESAEALDIHPRAIRPLLQLTLDVIERS